MAPGAAPEAALYVVATPIGNLGDITLRACEVLRRVSWVAAEDTRHTAPLLRHIGSPARLLAAHEHNEEEAAERIIAHLRQNEAVALVSDAGTPAISDPGARIVARVRAAGLRIIPLPGPCAAAAALSASGFSAPHWLFYGFLPTREKQLEKALAELRALPYALVFYEAPHRIVATVRAMEKVFGGVRRIVLAREISKLFETIHSAPLAEAITWLEAEETRQKGEFVLLLDTPGAEEKAEDGAETEKNERVLRLLVSSGLPLKQAVALTQEIAGGSRNALYARALELKP